MDLSNKKRITKYDKVMSRLYNRSRTHVKPKSFVTRHEIPSSVSLGAKPSSSNVNSNVFSDLPEVLNDYSPEVPVRRTFVVKPRRTVKSLDPATSPQRMSKVDVGSTKRVSEPKAFNIRAGGSAPVVRSRSKNGWSDTHVRQCLSSRSHTRLQELKDEIKEFRECDKKMKLRSRLYQSCGVVLDDLGRVASDKAVQVEATDDVKLRRAEWLQLVCRKELLHKNPYHYVVCEKHFERKCIMQNSNRKLLRRNSLPSLYLPDSDSDDSDEEPGQPKIKKILEDRSTQTDKPACLRNDLNECTVLSKYSKKKVKLNDLYNLSEALLSKELAELVKALTHLRLHKIKDEKYFEYELFCIFSYYASPKVYTSLQLAMGLPSVKSLTIPSMPLATEVNDRLMMTLKAKVDNMTNTDKVCSVIVGTITLKPNLFYNIGQDKIIGFCEVDGVQYPMLARKALVVSVQNIKGNWIQPIGFALIGENGVSENISSWIDRLLEELLDIGVNVKTFVSDFELLNEAKRKSVSIETPYFFIDDHKIYYIFDISHLMKSLLHSFMTNDFQYQNEICKWEHLINFYESDKNKSRRLAPKLTRQHVSSKDFESIEDHHAVELFSRSVATGVSTYIDFGAMDEAAKGTVELLSLINDLFDVLNSSFNRDEYQIATLKKALDLFSSLLLFDSKIGALVISDVDFVEGFQITIKSVLLLFNDLKREKIDILTTKILNQNVIKKVFHKRIARPTTRQFIRTFQRFVFTQIVKPPKRCTDDVPHFVSNMKRLQNLLCVPGMNNPQPSNMTVKSNMLGGIRLDEKAPVKVEYISDDEHSLPIEHPSSSVYLETCINVKILPKPTAGIPSIPRSDYVKCDLPDNDQLTYISIYLLNKTVQQHKHCSLLRSYAQPQGQREDDPCILVLPGNFVSFVHNMEQHFRLFFKNCLITDKISEAIFDNFSSISYFQPCPCFPLDYVKVLFIRLRIYNLLKYNNKALRTGASKSFFVPF